MTKGGMPKIVTQGNCLSQILVQVQRPGDGPCNLGHLQSVGQSGPVVVTLGREKDLILVLQAAERLGMDNPVPIPLEFGAEITRLLFGLPTLALFCLCRLGCQLRKLPFLGDTPDIHTESPPFLSSVFYFYKTPEFPLFG